MKSHSGEQVNLLGSCFPVKGMSYERMLYAVIISSFDYLNLLLLHRFAQLCFLCNESSLALTANASKHMAKTVICSNIGSYFQDMQI